MPEPCVEEYEDIVMPLAYFVFFCHSVRQRVFREMGMDPEEFSSVAEYAKWVGKIQDTEGALYNIHEVIIKYFELYPNGGCS
jgi:hypothetical protein